VCVYSETKTASLSRVYGLPAVVFGVNERRSSTAPVQWSVPRSSRTRAELGDVGVRRRVDTERMSRWACFLTAHRHEIALPHDCLWQNRPILSAVKSRHWAAASRRLEVTSAADWGEVGDVAECSRLDWTVRRQRVEREAPASVAASTMMSPTL